jgi:molecular chaperone HscB
MTLKSIPVRSVSTLECGSCGAGAPVDEHFCPHCSRILALDRHGDYFRFMGLPRRLRIDPRDLDRRFRQLSRQFHPDFFHNATTTERLASLERSSYLNDAYRVLRDVHTRIEYLLALEGLASVKADAPGTARVPASLLEEVFALNEELDEIRQERDEGGAHQGLRDRLARAAAPIREKQRTHEMALEGLLDAWDGLSEASTEARRATLEALREQMVERHYITNLLATLDRERTRLEGER